MICLFAKDIITEVATKGVLWKKVFFEIWQNSQEDTCVRVSFLIKLQGEEHLFYRTPLDDCFCHCKHWSLLLSKRWDPASVCLFNYGNTGAMCEVVAIKTPEQCQWCFFSVFTVNFKQISHIVLVFQLLALNK